MAIILFIFSFFAPRIIVVLLWFFSHWFDGVFSSLLWPIIGFIFLPTTLLWYSVVFQWYDNSWGTIPIAGLIIAVLIDLSPAAKKRRRKRNG
ncbi:MAG: hypothetical protein NTX22_12660 [Ignavibacteriales bacterium]|nr:hypothetical protein [Ignavibacteriales bacterium]